MFWTITITIVLVYFEHSLLIILLGKATLVQAILGRAETKILF